MDNKFRETPDQLFVFEGEVLECIARACLQCHTRVRTHFEVALLENTSYVNDVVLHNVDEEWDQVQQRRVSVVAEEWFDWDRVLWLSTKGRVQD